MGMYGSVVFSSFLWLQPSSLVLLLSLSLSFILRVVPRQGTVGVYRVNLWGNPTSSCPDEYQTITLSLSLSIKIKSGIHINPSLSFTSIHLLFYCASGRYYFLQLQIWFHFRFQRLYSKLGHLFSVSLSHPPSFCYFPRVSARGTPYSHL